MEFLDEVINKAKKVADVAGKKTDDAVQYSKLKIKEAQLNGDIRNKFEKLGSLIYQMAKSDDKNNDEFDALIAEIDECYEKLSDIDGKIDELKNEVTCPKCGKKTKRENEFCPKCGEKLPEPPAEDEYDFSDDETAEDEIKVDKDDETEE
jgi:ribosomal protein S27AE